MKLIRLVFQEQPLLSAHTRDIWLTQKSATQLIVDHSSNRSTVLHADIPAITGVSLNERHLVITNNRSIAVYKIARPDECQEAKAKTLHIKHLHTYSDSDCVQLFIWDETVIVLCRENIKFYSLGGVILRELFFSDAEGTEDAFADMTMNKIKSFFFYSAVGSPIGASLTDQYLTVFTLNGFVKVYDVSRHEPKLLTPSKSGYDLFRNFGEIILAKCNATASLVAITIASESLVPDGKVYVWDVERDIVGEYDFLLKNKIPDEQKSELFATIPATVVPR